MEIIKKGSEDVFKAGALSCCWPPGAVDARMPED